MSDLFRRLNRRDPPADVPDGPDNVRVILSTGTVGFAPLGTPEPPVGYVVDDALDTVFHEPPGPYRLPDPSTRYQTIGYLTDDGLTYPDAGDDRPVLDTWRKTITVTVHAWKPGARAAIRLLLGQPLRARHRRTRRERLRAMHTAYHRRNRHRGTR